jgi:hypothetical protein
VTPALIAIAIKELIVDQEEKGTVQQVEVLRYGDEPVIEPGQVMLRVIRWALTRIRERPAYTQLREHIAKIDELKAQL